MGKNLKILQIYDHMKLGGAETHIITLSKALQDLGHHVWIMASDGPAVQRVKEEEIPFVEVVLDTHEGQLEALCMVVEFIREHDIDVIHTHPFNAQIVGALAANITKIPCITTAHGIYNLPCFREPLKSMIDKIICVSNEIFELCIDNDFKIEKLLTIPNAIPIIREPNKTDFFTDNQVSITYISRLDQDKIQSLYFLLEAVSSVSKEHKIKLCVVGEGEKLEEIKSLALKINLDATKEIIHVVGGILNPNAFIEKSDIVVGVGRVLLEALSLGKFAICIGNNHYPGFVNINTLLEIAKVNFTDRNCQQPFSVDALIRDIDYIVKDFSSAYRDLIDSWQLASQEFSIEKAVLNHLGIYYSTMEDYIESPVSSRNWSKINPLSEDLKILLSYHHRKNYAFLGAKKYKLLLQPNFYNKEDGWQIALTSLFSQYNNKSDVTIIIRIDNADENVLGDIFNQLGGFFDLWDSETLPDILVDTNPLNKNEEIVLLSSVDAFVVTNPQQTSLKIKCQICGIETIEDGFGLRRQKPLGKP